MPGVESGVANAISPAKTVNFPRKSTIEIADRAAFAPQSNSDEKECDRLVCHVSSLHELGECRKRSDVWPASIRIAGIVAAETVMYLEV